MSEALRLTIAEIRQADVEIEGRAAQTPDRLKPGTTSHGATAVAGCGGNLFIGLGSNRWEHHYMGRVDIARNWFEAWREVLERRQDEARRRGVELWNFVIPEKQVVIPEQRWTDPPSADGRPFRQLLDHLVPEHQVHYALPALTAAKAQGPVYFVRNSHWCASGCLAAVVELTRALGVTAEVENLRFAYRRATTAHDLPMHFFESPLEVELGRLDANGPYTFEHHTLPTTGSYVGSQYGIRNPEAPDPRRVAIFGDSFTYDAGLAWALSGVFAEVSFLWSKGIVWEFVEATRADVVLWESAERFMVTLPAA